jgi:hypothetical protein
LNKQSRVKYIIKVWSTHPILQLYKVERVLLFAD